MHCKQKHWSVVFCTKTSISLYDMTVPYLTWFEYTKKNLSHTLHTYFLCCIIPLQNCERRGVQYLYRPTPTLIMACGLTRDIINVGSFVCAAWRSSGTASSTNCSSPSLICGRWNPLTRQSTRRPCSTTAPKSVFFARWPIVPRQRDFEPYRRSHRPL